MALRQTIFNLICVGLFFFFSRPVCAEEESVEQVVDLIPAYIVEEVNQSGTTTIDPRVQAAVGSDSTFSTLYVLGGGTLNNWVWSFDIGSKTWKNLSVAFSRQGACSSQDNNRNAIWIYGGSNDTFQTYTFSSNAFTTLTTPPAQLATMGVACAAAADGSAFYVLFGEEGAICSSTVGVWTAAKNWTIQTTNGTVPPARAGAQAVIYGTNIVLFGGNCGEEYYNDIYRLDLNSFIWTKDPAPVLVDVPPSPRSGSAVFILGDFLFVFGGQTASGVDSEAFVYNLITHNWTYVTANPVTKARFGATAISLQTRGLIFGGEGDGSTYNDLHQFVAEGFCLGTVCEDCTSTLVGCGWCDGNSDNNFKCIAGDVSAPYVASSCNRTADTYITDLDFCPQLFPSYAIALLVIGGVVVVGIVIFAIMKVRSGEEKPGYERIS